MTENSKMGSHENSGCREEKIRDGQRDSDRDRLCLEDAVVFIRLPAYSVFSSPPAPPPPLHPLPLFISCVGEQLCSSSHFELYRSVGDCVCVFVVILCSELFTPQAKETMRIS